ncbi:hypothetical protein BDW42DRAFT_137891 [Aspergillus taichungensis]|uniref:Uncharacterized protein n=1 Tax=Aspergillus taichungensis TaxID=482145 RepID=A0A2J5HNU2_9EURO|nr:hypothetical protein BDW42DRAFT_137891 [Aspergillus taichungensis]
MGSRINPPYTRNYRNPSPSTHVHTPPNNKIYRLKQKNETTTPLSLHNRLHRTVNSRVRLDPTAMSNGVTVGYYIHKYIHTCTHLPLPIQHCQRNGSSGTLLAISKLSESLRRPREVTLILPSLMVSSAWLFEIATHRLRQSAKLASYHYESVACTGRYVRPYMRMMVFGSTRLAYISTRGSSGLGPNVWSLLIECSSGSVSCEMANLDFYQCCP